MNAQYLLSVIVPIYNVEPYLDRCLQSIVNQTYRNLEIILVDDGSPDNCPAICEQWAARDNRIKVIHKQNAGLGMARNSGLEIATGDYVAFVDSDDYVDLDMYRILVGEIAGSKADMVVCGFKEQRTNNGPFVNASDYGRRYEVSGLQVRKQAAKYIPSEHGRALNCGVWHGIYSREVLTPFVSEREAAPEDIHFTVAAVLKSRKIVYIPDALYYYCCNGASLSRSFKPDYFDRFVRTIDLLDNLFASYDMKATTAYYLFNQLVNLQRSRFNKKMSLGKKIECYRRIVRNERVHDLLIPLTWRLQLRKNRVNLRVILGGNPWLFYGYSKFDKWVICKKFGLSKLK